MSTLNTEQKENLPSYKWNRGTTKLLWIFLSVFWIFYGVYTTSSFGYGSFFNFLLLFFWCFTNAVILARQQVESHPSWKQYKLFFWVAIFYNRSYLCTVYIFSCTHFSVHYFPVSYYRVQCLLLQIKKFFFVSGISSFNHIFQFWFMSISNFNLWF